MLVTQETQDKIDKLPLPLRMAANALLNALENLIGNKCDNEEILRTMSDFNDFAQGKYGDKDLVNYDEACDILGYTRTNRIALKRELDRNGIKQVVINNQRVGFPRHKVEGLLHKKK
jgi:DNA repair ATPase RecN